MYPARLRSTCNDRTKVLVLAAVLLVLVTALQPVLQVACSRLRPGFPPGQGHPLQGRLTQTLNILHKRQDPPSPLLSLDRSHKCFPDGLTDAQLDASLNVTLMAFDWDSNRITNLLAYIVLTERLGIKVNFVSAEAALARANDLSGKDLSWNSTRTWINVGAMDGDLENWDEYSGSAVQTVETVNEALLGYLGSIDWVLPSYVTDFNPDFKSYMALKQPANARLFNTAFASTIDSVPALPTTDEIVGQRLVVPACTPSSPQFNLTTCLHDTVNASGGGGLRGVLISPSSNYWASFETPIVQALGLHMDVVEMDWPIEPNLFNHLISAYRARRPWIGYMHRPSAVMSRIANMTLEQMSLPEYSAKCQAQLDFDGTRPCGYGKTFVKRFVSTRLQNSVPAAYEFLTKLRIDEPEMNDMMADIFFNNQTAYQAACTWLKASPSKWEYMLPKIYRSRPVCPLGTEARQSGQFWSCSTCSPGSFNLVSDGKCLACPVGGVCPGGETLLTEQGFWFDEKSPMTEPKFYQCPGGNCCPQGSCSLKATCPADRTGIMCNTCAVEGHAQWNGICADCKRESSNGLLSVPVLAALVFVAVFVVICNQDESVFMSDFLLFYQLASFLLNQDDVARIVVLKILTFDSNALLSPIVPRGTCLANLSNLDRVIMKAITPFGFIGVLALYHALAVAINRLHKLIPSLSRLKRIVPKDLRSSPSLKFFFLPRYTIMFNLTFMPIVGGALSLLNCRTIGSHGRFLVEAPDVQCLAGRHIPAFLYAVVVLVIWLAIVPVLVYRKLQALNRDKKLRDLNMLARWGVFYCTYKIKYPYWGIIDMCKTALITLISTVVPKDSTSEYLINLLLVVIVLWVFVIEQWYIKPLASRFENNFRFFTYVSMLLLCANAMVQSSAHKSESEYLGLVRIIVMGIFLSLPLLMLPWYMAWKVLVSRRRAELAAFIEQQGKSGGGGGGKKLRKLPSQLRPEAWSESRIGTVLKMYQWFGDVEDVVLLKDQLEVESRNSQQGETASRNGMLSSTIPNGGSVMLAVPSTANTIRRDQPGSAASAATGGNGSGLIPQVVSASIQRARSSTMPAVPSSPASSMSLLGVKKVGAIDTSTTGQRTNPSLIRSAAMSPTTEEEDGTTSQSSTTVASSAGQLSVSTAGGGKQVTSVKAQTGTSDSDVLAAAALRLPASRAGTVARRLDKQEPSANPLLRGENKVGEAREESGNGSG